MECLNRSLNYCEQLGTTLLSLSKSNLFSILIKDKCSWITPVPGGVGPMTIASLMQNTLLALEMKNR